MTSHYPKLYQAILLGLFSYSVTPLAVADDIETITVLGEKSTEKVTLVDNEVSVHDIADNLLMIPGANVNKNGALTGIVQYRGLYGDRIATKVGGQTIIGAGPNAMDPPLSYSPNIITENVIAYRGIAPITAGIETLGGAVDTVLRQATLQQGSTIAAQGKVLLGYQSNANAQQQAGAINIASDNFATLVYVDRKKANHLEAADGRDITPSAYTKIQSGLDTRFNVADSVYGFSYHYNDTHDAGTPALPMDIDFIYGHRLKIDGVHSLKSGELKWHLGYMDADHKMDNFKHRINLMTMKHRVNHAQSNSISFNINWQNDDFTIGADGYQSTHDSVISNPNNMMFNVVNFNDVKDSKFSLYTQWQTQLAQHLIKFGIRAKHISADADKVNHHMAMMNPTVSGLVQQFNQADRSQSDTNLDMTFDWLFPEVNNVQFMLSIAQKQRAPSYQERYLWLPMEATAGLADGNTYLGNTTLDSETARQVNLGLTYQQTSHIITADIFYSDIKDYIQGIENSDMAINMFANMMMNSDKVLKFSNLDAELYGFDGYWSYQLNSRWQLASSISYVRGKRSDISDNLYRVAPLNGYVALSYQQNDVSIKARIHGVGAQNNVSTLNREQKTSGYGYIDLLGQYQVSRDLTLDFGIKNLTDRQYTSHLSAYNRVAVSEIAMKERLPSNARSLWLSANYQF